MAVAMALANEPDLLLADEVTGELDSATAGEVMAPSSSTRWRERGPHGAVRHAQPASSPRRAQHRLRLVDGAGAAGMSATRRHHASTA